LSPTAQAIIDASTPHHTATGAPDLHGYALGYGAAPNRHGQFVDVSA
jgi:hypothetical protein